MTIVNNRPRILIKAQDAKPGSPYYWQVGDKQILVMSFTPCNSQERGCEMRSCHFIRLDEDDVSGILFGPEEELTLAGNLTCTIDPF